MSIAECVGYFALRYALRMPERKVVMTNEQILKKAIEKAVKGGWDAGNYKDITGYEEWVLPSVIIFSHDFAKAFWNKQEIGPDNLPYSDPSWRNHLQRMVLEKEPLKYLERFL